LSSKHSKVATNSTKPKDPNGHLEEEANKLNQFIIIETNQARETNRHQKKDDNCPLMLS